MLEVEGIGKSIGGVTLVDGVDLQVARGEVVGLLGPGGAGKTTTFRLITGILAPDRGRVFLDGADVTGLPVFERARRGLGFLPQEPSVIPGLTVEDNVRLALEVQDLDRAARAAALDGLLELFHLTHLRRAAAGRLSGGERRRCEIARTLAANPGHVLLDEPFAGIDPLSVQDVRDHVALLRDLGIGVLITDHNARELLGSVDRAYVIDAGRVLCSGTPREIVADPDVRAIYLGEDFAAEFPAPDGRSA